MKHHVLTSLEDISLCTWPTASTTRAEHERILAEIAAHPADATVTTCQRVEVLSIETGACGAHAPSQMKGRAALQHLAEVAAGLHSVVLGEPQVLGQVRTGLSHAPAGLRRYGDIALAAARELRRRESFTMHSGHLLDRGLAALGVRPGGRLLVLGAGHMGRLVAARGLEMGFTEVIIASRMAPVSAPERARFVPLSHIKELGAVDVIAGCLGASAPELDPAGDLPRATAIIDLGTPRNFSASNSVVTLAQLLSDHEAHETTRRRKLAEELSRLLDRRIEMASRDSNSALGMLRRELDRVRRREANRIQRLHPEIAPDAIEVITRSLVNQLFHLPAERLRDLDDVSLRDRLIELFVNDDAEPEQAAGPVHVPEPALMAAAAQ